MNPAPPVRVSLRYQGYHEIVQLVDKLRSCTRKVQRHGISSLRDAPENGGEKRRRRIPGVGGMKDRPPAEDAREDVRRRPAKQGASGVGHEHLHELASIRGRKYVPYIRKDGGQEAEVTLLSRRRLRSGQRL